jgi:hypothetical protein
LRRFNDCRLIIIRLNGPWLTPCPPDDPLRLRRPRLLLRLHAGDQLGLPALRDQRQRLLPRRRQGPVVDGGRLGLHGGLQRVDLHRRRRQGLHRRLAVAIIYVGNAARLPDQRHSTSPRASGSSASSPRRGHPPAFRPRSANRFSPGCRSPSAPCKPASGSTPSACSSPPSSASTSPLTIARHRRCRPRHGPDRRQLGRAGQRLHPGPHPHAGLPRRHVLAVLRLGGLGGFLDRLPASPPRSSARSSPPNSSASGASRCCSSRSTPPTTCSTPTATSA